MKRPLPYMLFFFCLGIYISDGIDDRLKLSAAVLFMLAAALVCGLNTKRIFTSLFALTALAGIFVFKAALHDPIQTGVLDKIAAEKGGVTVTGVVTDVSESGDRKVYRIKTERISFNGESIVSPYGIRVFCKKDFSAGDILKIESRLYAHNGKFAPSDFDNRLYLRIHGVDYSMYENEYTYIEFIGKKPSLFYSVKNKMYALRGKIGGVFDKYFTPEQAGILKAVTTGDKGGLDNDIRSDFKDAGIYHFLAISGLHISVIAAFLVYTLGKISKRAAYAATMIILAFYWVLTGGSVSVTRAVLMIYIYLSGKLVGRDADIINSASAAAFILLLYDPLNLFDTGFLYSFSAVFGIGIAFMPLKNYNKKGRKIVFSAAASFGAALFTRLITLVCYYTLNIYEIMVNFLLIPFMSLIVVWAMTLGVLGLTGINIMLAAAPLGFMLDILTRTAAFLSRYSVIKTGCPTYGMFLALLAGTLAAVLFLLRPSKRRFAAVLAFIPLLAITGILQKDDGVKVNFLYVGQGNCCVITKGKNACIMDCGGSELSDIGSDNGTYKVLPFLNYSGVEKVEAVFISHTDTDHIKGLFDLMGKIEIDNIYISRYVNENENYKRLLLYAKNNGIPVNRLSAGDKVTNSAGGFGCVYPFELDEKENNKNSMVIKAELDGMSVLFTGDIDKKCENEIVKSGADINADILEVPHHGSSSSGRVNFIKAVSPRYAAVSAGLNNRYGHPSKEIVEKMKKYGISLYKTYDGMISFVAKDGNFTVYRYENLEYNNIVSSLR